MALNLNTKKINKKFNEKIKLEKEYRKILKKIFIVKKQNITISYNQ